MAVTCMALGIDCHLTGLHTLKIKETDRLVSLKTELEKCGALVTLSESSLSLQNPNARELSPVTIATYNDHRMAMAFAPLALVRPISIESAAVVSKSYPNFWNDLKTIGFQLKNS
jgi:3-phosphoshikimate 1-carboxyvinyltransferase